MKISFDWLNQMLPVRSSIEDASAVLTATGLEVEGIASVESIPGGLAGLVAGQIVTCPATSKRRSAANLRSQCWGGGAAANRLRSEQCACGLKRDCRDCRHHASPQ